VGVVVNKVASREVFHRALLLSPLSVNIAPIQHMRHYGLLTESPFVAPVPTDPLSHCSDWVLKDIFLTDEVE
jgi:hypothetical protein